MFRGWLGAWNWIGCCLLLLICQPIFAQQPGRQPEGKPNAYRRIRNFVGVIGAVERPGVFEFTESSPEILEVISQAGSLTAEASGTVQIIRNGRAGQQTFLSPKLRFRLLPGDLIFVGHRQGVHNAHYLQQQQAGGQQISQTATPQSAVQVGLVNLIDRPVVLNVRPEHASVAALVRLLGQRLTVIPTVRRIGTTTPRFSPRPLLTPTSVLPSGTVLLFERAVIDPQQIPPLPEPIRASRPASTLNLETAMVSNLATDGSAARISSTTAVGQTRVSSEPGRFHLQLIEGEETGITLADGATDEILRFADAGIGDSNSALENDNFFAPPPPVEEEAGRVSLSLDEPPLKNRDKSETSAASPVESDTNDEEASVKWWTVATGLIGGVVTVCSVLLLWSMAKNATAVTATPDQNQEVKLLDALINDEFSLTEEAVQFPASMQFFGHPTGHRKIQIDAAHTLRGPHFRSTVPANTEEELDDTLEAKPRQKQADNQQHGGGRFVRAKQPVEQQKTRMHGRLDRALANIHGVVQG